MSKATPQAKALFDKLKKIDIKCNLEYWDGHKHVDIAILWAKLYVEVDGEHHFYNYKQMRSDDQRDYFSALDGFETLGVENDEVQYELNEVANWIAKIARARYYKTKG